MADAICLGELLIDFVPTITGSGLTDAPAFVKAPGGAPGNVAVGLARLGASSAFMGKVGDDAFGHFLAATLAEAGVDVGPLLFSKEARTALAFVSLRADGEREFMFYRHPSADMLFAPHEVDVESIRRAKLLHFGSISLIGEPSRGATLRAVDAACDAGALISYDPNLRLPLWPDAEAARDGLLLGLKKAQVVKISDEECAFLTGADDLEQACKALWHEGLKLIVATRGRAGCVYYTPTFTGAVDSFAVEAVDATGAGDGFVAGLLQGLLADPTIVQDESRLRELCRFASAVGALATLQRGAIPALPNRRRVLDFLRQA
ncbi:MAG TPA: PfkB family carbohydrate kinase [Candidatus Competibacter sp.]|nr:fructokinase [Candidatus Competibacteraceae bacterium]HRE54266.1 PfkB family carbohydrate kinase [Candidatus Competibacter sp.]HUM94208.1 PfkB family carbohydrate kinase [Candidatus Competibacter sp.]